MVLIEDVKEYLAIQSNEFDVILTKLKDQSVARINNIVCRDLNYGARYDVLNGNNETVIFLKNYPAENIEHIKYRETNSGFDYNLFGNGTIEDNLILINKTGKVILLNGYTLPAGESNVEIKYFAGYADELEENAEPPEGYPESSDCQVPPDLKNVCLMMTAELFLKSYCNIDGQFSKRLGLEGYEHSLSDTENTSRVVFRYKDEEYEQLLKKYRSERV